MEIQTIEDVIEARKKYFEITGLFPKYMVIGECFKDDIVSYINSKEKGFEFFYDENDELNTRIFGLRTKFIQENRISVFLNGNHEDVVLTDWVKEYETYCRNNHKQYINSIIGETESKIKGQTIEVDKHFLYEIACVLGALAKRIDEGNIPYPSAQNMCHRLSHDISRELGLEKEIAHTNSSVYDKMWTPITINDICIYITLNFWYNGIV